MITDRMNYYTYIYLYMYEDVYRGLMYSGLEIMILLDVEGFLLY